MKNIFRLHLIILIGVMAGWMACASQSSQNKMALPDDPRTAMEWRIDPLGAPGDQDIVTADVPAAFDSARSGNVVLPGREQNTRRSAQLFSVQIFATKSNSEARQFMESVAPMFEDEIRIDYRAPYYNVCVGKAHGLDDGEELLKQVMSKGFSKAWLVRFRE